MFLDLRKTDTGIYTCRAVSETGETARGAALVVETPTNPAVIFHRTPESSTFPGSPSRPTVTDVTESSVLLSWRPSSAPGASPVFSYTVEYFSHDTGEVCFHYCQLHCELHQCFVTCLSTLSYLLAKTLYHLALRPLMGPMRIPELTTRLQNPYYTPGSTPIMEASPSPSENTIWAYLLTHRKGIQLVRKFCFRNPKGEPA